MTELGAQISLDGWQSIQIVGASACVIFILLQKIQKMETKIHLGTTPWAPPHAYANRRWLWYSSHFS